MKLCKDCKHFKPLRFLWFVIRPDLAKCSQSVEPVSGEPKEFCDLSRRFGPCGEEGKFWEAA